LSDFALVGVLHLPALPGSPNYGGRAVRDMAEEAAEDAVLLEQAGFTHVIVQDANDKPQRTLLSLPGAAAMSSIGATVRAATSIPLGVVAGHNDGASAVAIAHAIGASFVRVKVLTGVAVGPEGFIEGCGVATAEMKRLLGADIQVWADAHEATSLPLTGTRLWAATEAVKFGAADALVVTSDGGVAEAVDWIAELRAGLPKAVPLIIGGRVTAETMALAVGGADGAIIGNAVKDGERIDPRRAAELVHAMPAGGRGPA
jgi:membrane complex biogenesis BtpA family protein